MVTDITNYEPLISCVAYDKEVLLKKCTIKQWHMIPDTDFVLFEWDISRRKNQIESVRNASSAEYFELNVLPWLSKEYKEEYAKIRSQCPKDIKHSLLLEKIKENYERKKYEEEIERPLTPEEKEQRRKIVELYKIKLWLTQNNKETN